MFRVMIEASGGMTSGYLIKSIQNAGHNAVATDINPVSVGRYLADDFFIVPNKSDEDLWCKTKKLVQKHEIDVVVPSLDETLVGWANNKSYFSERGVGVIISPEGTLRITQDKWRTYKFFSNNDIPTPRTSLEKKYPLVKPRSGRGGSGVEVCDSPVDMDGRISQEVVEGQEYTVDVFCNRDGNPIYIIPRKRLKVVDGKSVTGEVVDHTQISQWVRRVCDQLNFRGPINIQCFDTGSEIKFIEINPRIGGGMALGFEATENWIDIAIDHFVKGNDISPVEVDYGTKMMRYYEEVFVRQK